MLFLNVLCKFDIANQFIHTVLSTLAVSALPTSTELIESQQNVAVKQKFAQTLKPRSVPEPVIFVLDFVLVLARTEKQK